LPQILNFTWTAERLQFFCIYMPDFGACEAGNISKIWLDEVQWHSLVIFPLWSVFRAFEVEICELWSIITPNLQPFCNLECDQTFHIHQ
jgi:hypothetical protein